MGLVGQGCDELVVDGSVDSGCHICFQNKLPETNQTKSKAKKNSKNPKAGNKVKS